MKYKLDYKPTKVQKLFHASEAFETYFTGPPACGKTKAIVMEGLRRCLDADGSHAFIFTHDYALLRERLLPEAARSIPKNLSKYYKKDSTFNLVNGSIIHFSFIRNYEDVYRYMGCVFQWLIIDDLKRFNLEAYEFLKTRLRAPASMGIEPKIRCTVEFFRCEIIEYDR